MSLIYSILLFPVFFFREYYYTYYQDIGLLLILYNILLSIYFVSIKYKFKRNSIVLNKSEIAMYRVNWELHRVVYLDP